jgi:uncharacterized protein DUF3592
MSQEFDEYQRQLKQDQLDSNTTFGEGASHPANQPSYSYRDQSLSPTPELLPAIMARRRRFRLLRTLIQIGFVLLPFVGAWILTSHYAATYNTYQQGSCTIRSEGVNEVDTTDRFGTITSRTYYPQLSYEVHAANGAQATAMGYDGPIPQGYSSSGEARIMVAQYQIGQNVPCWYNPVTSEKAFIVFDGFTQLESVGVSFGGFCGFGAFALILYLLFDWMVWRLFALHKRGVVTQGEVSEIKERRDRLSMRHYTSIIYFQAQEESDWDRTIKVAGNLGVGTILLVCYDPLFPRYRRTGVWPGPSSPSAGVATIAVVSTIGLVILHAAWLIP